MIQIITRLFYQAKSRLEEIDSLRDRILFLVIKPYWPRFITPNHLTASRIAISLILGVLLLYYQYDNKGLVVFLFIIGALTDMFDGSVARGLNMKTKFGAVIDPIADKLLILPIAFYVMWQEYKLLLFSMIAAEVISGALSFIRRGIRIILDQNVFDKLKMVIQSVVFLVVLIFWPKAPVVVISVLWISVGLIAINIIRKAIAIIISAWRSSRGLPPSRFRNIIHNSYENKNPQYPF